MQQLMIFSILFISTVFGWCKASEACPECPESMIVKYNQRKETIESLLDAGKEKSVFTESLESLVPKVDDAQERSKLTSLINAMEKEIVQNVEIKSNRTKILKLAMKLDQLFLHSPLIEEAIKYEMLPGKNASDPWGPLIYFMHIVTEYNGPTFWALSTTPGKKTSCLITDHIKEISKGNDMIKKTLLLESPCAQTWKMANRMLQIHLDIPSPTERINLQSMQLPNLDMTFHQYQLVAAAYYATTSISCRRLRDMFGNYAASNFALVPNSKIKSILNRANNISADSSTQYCIDWWSGEVAEQMNSSKEYFKYFNKIFWNIPFGSFFDNLIYFSCQRDVLKKNAPQYYP